MKISSIYIDGFGTFHDQALSGLEASPCSIFLGNNEAGKSTFLGFIRSILFGFPRVNSKDTILYPPLGGGTLGGRIGLILDDSSEVCIQRYPGPGGGAVLVRSAHGEESNGDILPRLLGGMSADVFKNVYAFSLSELQTFKSLKGENVKSAIYGASSGLTMAAFPRAQKQVRDKLHELFKPGGSKPRINRKISELEKIKTELFAVTSESDDFDLLCSELEEVEKTIEMTQSQLASFQGEKDRLTSYTRLWDDWLLLQESESELQNLDLKVEAFPQNGVTRLESALNLLRNDQEQLQEQRAKINQFLKDRDMLHVDQCLLDNETEIGNLLENRKEYLENRKIIPLRIQEHEKVQREVDDFIQKWGKNWTENTVLEMDTSILARDRIRNFGNEMRTLEKEAEITNRSVAESQQRFEKITREEIELSDSLKRLGAESFDGDSDQIRTLQNGRNEIARILRDLPARKKELKIEKGRLENLIKEISPDWGEDEVKNFDHSIGTQKEIEDFGDRLAILKLDKRDAQNHCQVLESQLEKKLKKIQDLRRKTNDRSNIRFTSMEELGKEKSKLRKIQKLISEHLRISIEIRHLKERLEDKKRITAKSFEQHREILYPTTSWIFGIGFLLFIFLCILYFLVGISPLFIAATLFLSAFYIGILIVLSYFKHVQKSRTIARTNPLEENTEFIKELEFSMKEFLEKQKELDSEIERIGKQFNLKNPIESEDITTELDQFEKVRIQLEEKSFHSKKLIELEQDKRELEHSLEAAKEKEKDVRNSLNKVQDQWIKTLKSMQIRQEIQPDVANIIFSKIETARQQLNTIETLESQIRYMAKTLDSYIKIAETIPSLRMHGQDPSEDFLVELDKLFIKHQDYLKSEDERRLLLKTIKNKEKQKLSVKKAHEKLERDHAINLGNLKEQTHQWQEWLIHQNLPKNLSPDTALEALGEINHCHAKINKSKQLMNRISQISEANLHYENQLSNLSQSLKRSPIQLDQVGTAVNEFVKELEQNKGNIREQKRIDKEIQSYKSKIDNLETKIQNIETEVQHLYSEASANNEDEFRKREHFYHQRNKLLENSSTAQKNMRHISGQTNTARLIEILKGQTLEEITVKENEVQLKIDATLRLLENRFEKRAELRQKIELMKSSDVISELRTKEEQILAEIQQDAQKWACYAVAKFLLDRACETFEKEQQPKIIRDAGTFFKRITNSQYKGIFAPIGHDDFEVIGKNQEHKIPAELSRGTAEQLYLSIRFGYIKNRSETHSKFPVIMDDILVNFDPQRARNTAKAIVDLSKTQQILFFTCHPQTVALFQNLDPKIVTFEIRDGRFTKV